MGEYIEKRDFGIPNGLSKESEARLKAGSAYQSAINKINIIKLANEFPAHERDYVGDERFQPKTAYDLCVASKHMGAVQYDIEDFAYCKWFGQTINRLITLRRFPYPCTDNIYDRFNQAEPDMARMVTYTTNDHNKLEDVLSFGYKMKWKELTAEMEEGRMEGDQSGFSGISKKVMKYIDPKLAQNTVRGANKLAYDPKHDANKVYGPVDSLTTTHIRDVGLEFEKTFDLTFQYDLKSIDGKSPEMAMKDVLANILACTYNNAKFWPGSRYWVGERPSTFLGKFKYMNPDSVDEFFAGAYKDLNATIESFKEPGSAIKALKTAIKNGIAMSLGKLLDKVGRPSIPVMNSLLSGEPVGYWHVMIGNPYNPTMCIGNLIIDDVDVKFPTAQLSYGDFPDTLEVNVKLKPAMAKDKAGIEMMFNMGKQRIYHQPKSIKVEKNGTGNLERKNRTFHGQEESDIVRMAGAAINDFSSKTVNVVYDNVGANSTTNNNNSTVAQTSGQNKAQQAQLSSDAYET